MLGIKPPTPKPLATLGTAARKRRLESISGCRVRPEQVTAAHAPRIDNKAYAPDDVVITSAQMNRQVKRIRSESSVAYPHQEHYAPAEWWEWQYWHNVNEYYELMYGANNTRNRGIFCIKCQNTRCGWNPAEIPLFKDSQCPMCQKNPLDPLALPIPRQRRPRLTTRLLSREDLTRAMLTF
jgi:hypothetical protein